MTKRKPKRLYRVSGETESGHTRTYTFQTKGRAVSTALKWANGQEADSWWQSEIPKLKNVRIDVSEEVYFPSDHGVEMRVPLDPWLPKDVD